MNRLALHVRTLGIACLLVLLASQPARAQDAAPVGSSATASPHAYKDGELWPRTLVNGVDFLEPLLPVTAFRHGDVGRIVLGSALPYALLVSSFAAESTDHATSTEIRRRGWNWCGVDQAQDNYPVLFALVAIGGLSSFLPAPEEDADGYSLRLRLDRLTVFGAAVGLANAEVEILKPIFNRMRPVGSSNASRPSGHAATGFAAMAFCSDILGNTLRPEDEPSLGLRIAKETLTAVPYLGAFYLALERVHGAKHYLSDTLLGGALGVFTTQMLYEWSFLRVELKDSWLAGFDIAYENGGLELAWRHDF